MARRKPPANPDELPTAVRWFRSRVAVTKPEYAQMGIIARRTAFTIGGTQQLDVVQTVFDEMADAQKNGTSLDLFKQRIRETLGEQFTSANSARLNTSFRTQTQRAYNVGRWEQLSDPDITSALPYRMLDAVLDNATTPLCKRLNGTVLRYDHPFWLTCWPPLHWNCRTSPRGITAQEALRRGVHLVPVAARDIPDGFGLAPPLQGTWEPRSQDYASDLFGLFRERQSRRATRDNEEPDDSGLLSAGEEYELAAKPSGASPASPEQGLDPTDFLLAKGKSKAYGAEPRVPAGGPSGGQWTKGGAGSGSDDALAQRMAAARAKIAARVASKQPTAKPIVAKPIAAAKPKSEPKIEKPAVVAPPPPAAKPKPAPKAEPKKLVEAPPAPPEKPKPTPKPKRPPQSGSGAEAAAAHREAIAADLDVLDHTEKTQAAVRGSMDKYLREQVGLAAYPRQLPGSHALHLRTPKPGAAGAHSFDNGDILVAPYVVDHAREAFARKAQGLPLEGHHLKAVRTLLHESIHGHGNTQSSSYGGKGAIIEEAVTETVARHSTRKLLSHEANEDDQMAMPMIGQEATRVYDSHIIALMIITQRATGWSAEKTRQEFELGSLRYKSSTVRIGSTRDAVEHLSDSIDMPEAARDKMRRSL